MICVLQHVCGIPARTVYLYIYTSISTKNSIARLSSGVAGTSVPLHEMRSYAVEFGQCVSIITTVCKNHYLLESHHLSYMNISLLLLLFRALRLCHYLFHYVWYMFYKSSFSVEMRLSITIKGLIRCVRSKSRSHLVALHSFLHTLWNYLPNYRYFFLA